MNTPPTTTNEKEERSKRELKDPTSISDHNVKRQRTSHNATVEGILHYPFFLFYILSLSLSTLLFLLRFLFFIYFFYFEGVIFFFGNLFLFYYISLTQYNYYLFLRHDHDRLCNSGYNHT